MPWTTNLSQQRCMVNLIYNPFTPFFLLPVSVRLRFSYLFDCPLAVHGRPSDWIWDNFSALKPLKISMFSTVLAIQRMRLSKFKRHVTWLITVPSVVTWDVSFSDPRDVFISVKLGQAKSSSFVIMGALESDEANPSCLLLLLGRWRPKVKYIMWILSSHPIGQSLITPSGRQSWKCLELFS